MSKADMSLWQSNPPKADCKRNEAALAIGMVHRGLGQFESYPLIASSPNLGIEGASSWVSSFFQESSPYFIQTHHFVASFKEKRHIV